MNPLLTRCPPTYAILTSYHSLAYCIIPSYQISFTPYTSWHYVVVTIRISPLLFFLAIRFVFVFENICICNRIQIKI